MGLLEVFFNFPAWPKCAGKWMAAQHLKALTSEHPPPEASFSFWVTPMGTTLYPSPTHRSGERLALVDPMPGRERLAW